MGPICRLSLPEKTFRRDFGMITTWYLQSQRTWDKLCHSCRGSSFLPRGAFPEGRAYAVPQRLHAGSLEALRVSRPEAVVLAVNKCVSGRSKPASTGRLKTSHFEETQTRRLGAGASPLPPEPSHGEAAQDGHQPNHSYT